MPTSSYDFTDVTDGSLTFTGSNDPYPTIHVDETDVGDVIPFTAFERQPLPVDGAEMGMQWSGFASTVFGPTGSMTLTFTYDVVSNVPGELITSFNSLYVVDVATLGTGMTAIENVYDQQGNLIGTQTYTYGGPAAAEVVFLQGQTSVSVTLTIIETVASDSFDATIDMSYFQQTFGTTSADQLCTIGDYVWIDMNANGLQDGTDFGADGVTVYLTNADGSEILATTTTDSNGYYLFDHLQAGTYAIQFDGVDGFDFTTQGAGGNPLLDSDADQNTGLTGPVTLTAGQSYLGLDAGLVIEGSGGGTLASLGNYVWLDTDQDGIQDGNEAGIGGVTVNLLNSAGAVIGTDVTEADGSYSFVDLEAGTYQVQFGTLAGYGRTSTDSGTDDAVDSDAAAGTGLTGLITLAAGEVNNTIDAGLYVLPATASLGNFVWYDCDNDGKQDSGESGIAGVTVKLMAADGITELATTTTSSTGYYQFTNLTAGTYQVYFGTKAGYALTDANQGTNDAIDSDANTSTRLSGPIELSAGENDTTIDAGMTYSCAPVTASIGNYVWYDCDNDGKQDYGESGIGGVTVKLMAADGTTVLATTTTSSSGYYQFSNLTAGTYQVYFGTKSGYELTAANQGTNDGIDSDANTTTRLSGPIVLNAGENDNTIDAGMVEYCPPALASIGNFVWYDCDEDGKQDYGESGIGGVTVKLMAADGTTVLATTTTSSSGYYQFSNLAAGTYQVYFGTKSGYELTDANQGTNDTIDSDANTSTRLSGPIVLSAGETDNSVDAGMVEYCPPAPASIGNFVWYDCDNDGKQDYGESGIGGVTVKLMAADGTTVLATTTTSSSGYYQFSNLTAGTYQVYFGTKSGYELTAANQGTNDGIDSDANTTTRLSGPIVLNAGENDNTIDAGMVEYCPPATGSIGNFVWYDCDNDGKQDYGESGIGGVTVKLMAADGTTVLATTTTSSSGYYQFSNLAAGTYQVYFGTKSGYELTDANQGTSDTIDSDANTSTRLSGPVVLSAGENDNTIDAGMVEYCPPATGSIGNFVWYDCDEDGKQDYGESGISGVTVKLMAADGTTVLATTTTSSSGYYQFSNLTAGTYQVYFGTKSGYELTAANQGSSDTSDSDANTSTRLSGPVVLGAGENDTSVDAGMVEYCPPTTGSIGNFVWYDCDEDGKQDSGESGISGVTVKLMAADGTTVLATTTTSSSGYYQFSNLAAGTYQVYFGTKSGYELTAANQGTSDTSDSDANTSTRLSGPIALSAGENDSSVDAGMVEYCPPATGSIGNFVWYDCDEDGKQDSGESGISGVTVKLMAADGTTVLATTTTSSSGYYQFSNLTAGTYQVYFGTKSGYELTAANQGTSDTSDSDANTTTRLSGPIALSAGENDSSVDAGMVEYCPPATASLGNRVWSDVNRNGIQDSGETGLSGVTVQLMNAAGTSVLSTTTTNTSGNYQFSNLAAGTYQVKFGTLSGYQFTSADTGGNASVDSDANTSTRLSGQIVLATGQNNDTIDAGLFRTSTFASGYEGLSAGFWSTHTEAWDGAYDTAWDNLVCSDVLKSVDVLRSLPNQGKSGPGGAVGVLLGDSNANGVTDSGENTLFVSLTAARQLINSSASATDTRQILTRQAIAAQLNIDNGDRAAGGLTVGADLISKAVTWLKGQGPFIYSDGSSGRVDVVGTTGVLDAGTWGSIDYNTTSAAFTSTALTSNKMAWNTEVSLGTGLSDFLVSGQELKNALQAFNENKLVTSADGTLVGWNDGSSMMNLYANNALGAWSVLRDAGVI